MRTVEPAPIRRSVEVKATPERAFEAFTAGLDGWWPTTHSIGKSKPKSRVIEPHVGGRWYERGEDGAVTDWGRVLAFEPPHRLVLAWQINTQWQFDPKVSTEVEVRFTQVEPGLTRVELEHRHLERLGDKAEDVQKQVDALGGGWSKLLSAYAHAVGAPSETDGSAT